MNRYIKFFQLESDAQEWAEMKKLAESKAGKVRNLYVVTDGPSENFAVMDYKSYRELRS